MLRLLSAVPALICAAMMPAAIVAAGCKSSSDMAGPFPVSVEWYLHSREGVPAALRPDDWHEIWPELEEVETLRAQVAQLMERLRKYEPDAAPALAGQAPAAINSEARRQAREVA